MEPFDYLDDQAHAIDLIQRFEPMLVAEAAEILGASPGADLVGVVAERGGREWSYLRRRATEETGREIVDEILTGVLPRDLIHLVFEDHKTIKAWIDRAAPAFLRKFPVIAALRRGYQGKVIGLPDPPREGRGRE